MSVSKMKKLTLVSMKHDAKKITEKLMWLGCVEVEKSKQDREQRGAVYDAEKQSAAADIKLFEEVSAILIKLGNTKHGMFSPLPTVSKEGFQSGRIGEKEYSEIAEAAHGVLKRKKELDALEAELNVLQSKALSLSPFLSYDMKFSETETKRTSLMLGSLPKGTDVEKLPEILEKAGSPTVVEVISADSSLVYVAVVYMKDSEEAAVKAFSKLGFNRITFPGMTETPDAELSKIKEQTDKVLSDIKILEERLEKDAALFDEIQIALDMASTSERLAETRQRLFATERTVILSGWVPAEHVAALEKALKNEPVYFTLDEPEENDDVPVHLVNGKPAGYFESVVEMYSPPAYGSFDPTRIMMIFFFIIFGLMLADVVYGIIITLGCLFLIKKTNVSAGVKNMCGLFACCGISCTLFGVLFGSYLGDLPAQFMKEFFGIDIKVWAALDIMTESIVFLILSLALGAVHMLTGMGIRFYVLWTSGDRFAAIFDEGSWFVLFGGAGLFFLNSTVGIAVAATGVAMLILTQGRREKGVVMKAIKGVGSLYSLVNYMSDLLSYSRIMALGLSSAVVASVFNILATMGGPTVGGIIMLVLIIPLGHLLNLAINLLGTFVHTSRLQYVEFFGKFFEDGGRMFKPVKPEITHSVISAEAETE